MPRTLFLLVVATLGVIAFALPAGATSTRAFKADFVDKDVCPVGADLCGKGHIQGFGAVTTTFTFFPLERVITLDSDGSTLRLAIVGTDFTPPRLEGTFTIVGGTGVFDGATGDGVLWAVGTGVPTPSDTAHYRGTITLAD